MACLGEDSAFWWLSGSTSQSEALPVRFTTSPFNVPHTEITRYRIKRTPLALLFFFLPSSLPCIPSHLFVLAVIFPRGPFEMHERVASSVCGVSCCAGDWRERICKSTARLGNLANGLIGAKLCKWGFLRGGCAGTLHQCHGWWACSWKITACESRERRCAVFSPAVDLFEETRNLMAGVHAAHGENHLLHHPNGFLSLRKPEQGIEMRLKFTSTHTCFVCVCSPCIYELMETKCTISQTYKDLTIVALWGHLDAPKFIYFLHFFTNKTK